MVLVDYSSSEEEPGTSPPSSLAQGQKRKRSLPDSAKGKASASAPAEPLPALPRPFRDLYASAARVSTEDDPTLHGGRKRTVPHVEGNWPAHVYLEWYPSSAQREKLTCFLDAVQDGLPTSSSKSTPRLQNSLVSDLGTPLPLHISLSASLVLKADQRDQYLEAIANAVDGSMKGSGSFAVQCSGVDWAPNADGTRWFLALRVARPREDVLNRLLKACNHVSDAEGLSTLYRPPPRPHEQREPKGQRRATGGGAAQTLYKSGETEMALTSDALNDYTDRFHFSIAWTLDAPATATANSRLRAANVPNASLKQVLDIHVEFDEVKVKIGKEITAVPLSRRVRDVADLLT